MARPVKSYQQVLRSLPRSVKINRVSIGAEALYVRLLLLADSAGRYWASPFRVASLAFVERMERQALTVEEVAAWLAELAGVGLIVTYAVEGTDYLEITSYHRAADNRGAPEFPSQNGKGPDRPHSGDRPSPEWGRPVPRAGGEHEHEHEKEQEHEHEHEKKASPPATDAHAAHARACAPHAHASLSPERAGAVLYDLLADVIDQNAYSSARAELVSPRWLGGFPEDQVRSVLALKVEEAQDKNNPGAWILGALRRGSAGEDGQRLDDREPEVVRPDLQPYVPKPPDPWNDPDELERTAAKIAGLMPTKAAEMLTKAAELRATP